MARTATEIQADLTAARAARLKALEATSYSLDSGQGRQTVTRNLAEINKTIRFLEDELASVDADASGDGVLSMTYRRDM